MKTFFKVGLSILGIALLITIVLFIYIQYKINSVTPTTFEDGATATGSVDSATETEQTAIEPVSSIPSVTESIPLRTLPLTDTQKSALEAVNVDVETFEITPTMIGCAEQTLGADRFNEIIGGAAPSFMESVQLTRCIQ